MQKKLHYSSKTLKRFCTPQGTSVQGRLLISVCTRERSLMFQPEPFLAVRQWYGCTRGCFSVTTSCTRFSSWEDAMRLLSSENQSVTELGTKK